MKDSYYFPHDYHARHDAKIEELHMHLGCEGIGIYWCLVEMMYENNGHLHISKIPIYAKMLMCKDETLAEVVSAYHLFTKKGDKFYSKSLLARLQHINAKRLKARDSAKKRWDANAEHSHSGGNAIKESKEKESKEKKVVVDDASFLESLKKNIAYKHINIEMELGKMDAFLLTRPHRQKTRRFIVAWLNRVDKPVNIPPNKTVNRPITKPMPPDAKPMTDEERKQFQASLKNLSEKLSA
jgi:uncharacterized protein YdaU (DUF1376 family)